MLVQEANDVRSVVLWPLPTTRGDQGDWQARAVNYYRQVDSSVAASQAADLRARLLALTGRAIAEDAVWVDPATRVATVNLDGHVFRQSQGVLRLVRSCAHCGTGEFESPPIEGLDDLGYALSAWEPRHRDCEPEDSRDDEAAW